MTAIFGRNRGTATGPQGDLPVESQRFHALVDDEGNPAVYDAVLGVFAPGLDADAAADFNTENDLPDNYP